MAIVNGQYVPDVNSMAQWGQTPVVNPSQISSTGVGADALNNPTVQQNLGYTQGINSQQYNTQLANSSAASDNWLSRSSAFGGTDAMGNISSGWAAPALGALGGLAQSWLGFKSLGLAREQLDFTRNAWQEQFNMQKEEYDFQKKRRDERMANYEASLNRSPASSPTQRVVGATM